MTAKFQGKYIFTQLIALLNRAQFNNNVRKYDKWIKQYLHIKTFYGTTKNTVYTQILITICDYLLLIIAKKHYMLNPSLHSILKFY